MTTPSNGSGPKRATKILIVDDHPIIRAGLAALFARAPDLEVGGSAGDSAAALEQMTAIPFDLVLIEICLESGRGLDLIQSIKARWPATKMLVVSMYDETLYAQRCLHAGAMGYLNKQVPSDKIVEAVRRVLAGKIYLSVPMTEPVKLQARCTVADLTNRELEVFQLIGRGMTTQAIAKKIHLSHKTVETYRAHIKVKLNLHNGVELTEAAVRWVLDRG